MLMSRDGFKLFAYLGISALLSFTVWTMVLVPDYLSHQGWPAQKIGWAMGLFFIVALFSQVFSGHLADRIGNVPTALIGTGIALGGCIFYWVALRWPDAIFAARALHGAGAAMVGAGALFHLVRSVPQNLKGRVMGYFGLPGFVMMGVGPLIAERLRHSWGMAGVFTLILVNFVAVGVLLRCLPRPLAPKGTRREPFSRAFRESFPNLRPVIFFAFCFGFGLSAWNSFLAPTVSEIGSGAISAFGVGYGSGALVSRLGLSQKLDRGKNRLIAISSLTLYGVGLALIPHADHPWHLGMIGLGCGVSHGLYYPALSSFAAARFHPLHTGSAMSLYMSAFSLGMFLGSPFWGYIGNQWGYLWIFTAAGLFVFCSTLIFLISRSWSRARRLIWPYSAVTSQK
ncbi:MAG: MFS transporter [Acidobacteria bacterium]|nr:MFS transporter [Acidobacteriota bacterium]